MFFGGRKRWGKPLGGLFADDHRSIGRGVYVAAGAVGPVAVSEPFGARPVGVGDGVKAVHPVPPNRCRRGRATLPRTNPLVIAVLAVFAILLYNKWF